MAKTKNYRLLLKKLLGLFIIVFAFDLLIGEALKYLYFHQKSGRQYRAHYTIEKTNADVLIFGSSRAYNHYRPDILEKKLDESCYNTGSPGQFILYHYATLKAVLKRYTPKLIILDLMPMDLATETGAENSYERLSFLHPYYMEHKEMRSVIDLKSKYEKFKLFSSIYPYNSTMVYTVAGYLNPPKFQALNKTDKGYQASFEIWKQPSKQVPPNPNPPPIDTVKANAFKFFIEECKKAGSELVVVCSPRLDSYMEEFSLTLAKNIAREKGIKFIDFTNDSFFVKHPEYFAYDPTHLNHDGAGIFTERLVDSVRRTSLLTEID